VQLRTLDFFNTVKHEPVGETPTLIANPPYGQRMEKDETEELYKQIGSTFKRNFDGFDCWVISSNMEALKKIGLSPKLKIPLFNGALDCRFNKYPMYKGTKRIFDNDNSEIPNDSVE
jgi:putative N6-adenine-specific DNA methylase